MRAYVRAHVRAYVRAHARAHAPAFEDSIFFRIVCDRIVHTKRPPQVDPLLYGVTQLCDPNERGSEAVLLCGDVDVFDRQHGDLALIADRPDVEQRHRAGAATNRTSSRDAPRAYR